MVVEERHSVPVRQQRRQTGAALVLLCSGQLGAVCTRLYLVFSSSSFCLFLPGLIFVVISFFAILFSLLFLQCCSKCCTYKSCTHNVVSNVVHTMLYQCGNTVMHVYVGVYVFRTVYHRVVPSFFRLLELSQLSEAIKSVLNKPGGPMQKSEVNKQTFSSLE